MTRSSVRSRSAPPIGYNMEKYPRGIEVVAGAYIINDENQLLLAKSPKFHNNWAICGGHIEVGETIAEATKREIKEELGVDIELLGMFACGDFFVDDKTFTRNAHCVYFDSVARLLTHDFKLDNREATELRWFDIDEALHSEYVTDFTKQNLPRLKDWLGRNRES